ncbi:receptor-transporting protein 3 [Halichoerus grypus]|uniref:receptor-transporting protein 3 n=1 Tax=Halichoerus grypus TaxID=9711 RepID=UPI001658D851|nr:receptor-transporting protein 3 [Halichoerus grypus]XP_035963555.1 receptor-transporting protein 3 [Halichoerus grypus]XP_035963556.1 receptor-transporting protein 3 [Halichoerus grypus]
MSQDMELWKQTFQELIQEVKPCHEWTLTVDKDLLPNSLKPGWSQYQQRAFARFQCSLCSRSWASAQVQVLFHMHKSEGKPRGKVKMRVFAQRCQKCNQSPFEVPEFTKENISRILNNLVFRILKKCYREGFKSMETIPTINEISLEGPHDSNNCEACLQGFCAQRGSGEALQSPALPSLPAVSSPALGTAIPTPSPTRSGAPADTVKGNTRADAVKGNAMGNKGKALPQPWCTVSTKAAILPTHWSPRPNTHHHVERRTQVSTCSEEPYCHTAWNLRCRNFNACCCFFILIIVVVIIVVVIIVETIPWTST